MKKINYSLKLLVGTYEQLRHVLSETNEDLVKEMACNAFLREAYELEVFNHGGLDNEKIEQYFSICRSFRGIN